MENRDPDDPVAMYILEAAKLSRAQLDSDLISGKNGNPLMHAILCGSVKQIVKATLKHRWQYNSTFQSVRA